jgi:hypothetical protein
MYVLLQHFSPFLLSREVLGAGRGVQAGEVEIPAMAAEAGRGKRDAAGSTASDEESDGCDGAQDCNTTY